LGSPKVKGAVDSPPGRLGCLRSPTSSPEQRAAYEWCKRAFPDAETLSLDDGRLAESDLGAYDVLWWHTDEIIAHDRTSRVSPDALTSRRESLKTYLREGGSLLLTLGALRAVPALGIDPVGPDAVGTERPPERTGYLIKSLHADHPAFEGIEGLRVATMSGDRSQSFARYERRVPDRGEVLACAYREGDVPTQKTVLAWDLGAGRVLGAGVSLSFAGSKTPTPAEITSGDRRARTPAANRATLTAGLLNALDRSATASASIGTDSRVRTRPKSGEEFARLRGSLAANRNRPQYHLTPPANWLNDPNGVIEYGGKYHVFYQYNPAGPFHGTIHWGHAVSDDLVHWEDRPVALSPSIDGPDRDGCWSGCVVVEDGTPTLVYTGGRDRRQLPCLARARSDALDDWRKDENNPIIDDPPADPPLLATERWEREFRDHCVWYENDRWYQLIGSGVQDVGGAALLYEGPTLSEWAYRGPALVGDWDGAGAMWECPELLRCGAFDLLHVSTRETVEYYIGVFDPETGRFERRGERGRLDHGDFYAPQSLTDRTGRHLTWGWSTEARDASAQWDAGWSGTLTLPRALSVSADGMLEQRPASELESLRTERLFETAGDRTGEIARLDDAGTAFEVGTTLTLLDAEAFELVVRESPNGAERTPIRYTGSELVVDREHTSHDERTAADPQRLPLGNDGGDGIGGRCFASLDLRVFVDGSIIEVFANERQCLTSRIYPTREDATGLSIRAIGGPVSIGVLEVWELTGAWPARNNNCRP
jgi:beta-fructofuranosidase